VSDGIFRGAQRTEMGGVPAYVADIPGAARAALVFRVGQADETLPRLAARRVLRLAELRDDPLVVMRPEPEADTHALYLDACAQAGFVPRVAQLATSLQALLGFVAAGLGWGFVAAPIADGLRRDGVRVLRLRGTDAVLPTALAWPAGALSPPARLVHEQAAMLRR